MNALYYFVHWLKSLNHAPSIAFFSSAEVKRKFWGEQSAERSFTPTHSLHKGTKPLRRREEQHSSQYHRRNVPLHEELLFEWLHFRIFIHEPKRTIMIEDLTLEAGGALLRTSCSFWVSGLNSEVRIFTLRMIYPKAWPFIRKLLGNTFCEYCLLCCTTWFLFLCLWMKS